MQTEWEPDELIDTWTLTGTDWDLIANKAGATRLGFAAMLKFYEIEGRFPAYREEVPPAVIRYLGSLVKVDPALYARYPWTGRSIKYHKAQIRRVYGTRPRPRTTKIGGHGGWPRRYARPRPAATAWPPHCGGAAAARKWSRRPLARWSAWSPRAAGSSTTPSPR